MTEKGQEWRVGFSWVPSHPSGSWGFRKALHHEDYSLLSTTVPFQLGILSPGSFPFLSMSPNPRVPGWRVRWNHKLRKESSWPMTHSPWPGPKGKSGEVQWHIAGGCSHFYKAAWFEEQYCSVHTAVVGCEHFLAKLPSFKMGLHYLRAVWAWAEYFNSFCLILSSYSGSHNSMSPMGFNMWNKW